MVGRRHTGLTASLKQRLQLLLLARLIGVGLVLVAVALFAAGVPARYAALLASVETMTRPLSELGLSPVSYALYVSTLDVTIVLVHVALALLIIWYRAEEWVALLVAAALVSAPLTVTRALETGLSPGQFVANIVHYVGLLSSVLLLYLFPNGRFVPPWSRLLVWAWAGLMLLALFLPAREIGLAAWPRSLWWVMLLGFTTTAILAQLYRYARVSSAAQREQTRWAVLGLIAATLAPIGYFFPFITLPSLSQPTLPLSFYYLAGPSYFTFLLLFRLVGFTLFTLVLLLFPLSFAIAIRRYRLWEIELILNRTLVYSVLSAMLLLVYGSSIVFFEWVLRRVSGQDTDIAIMLSTLVIAVLFNPLRQRIQSLIDRRFYRCKYDAHTILASFAAFLRDEPHADLTHLTDRLVAVIEETMQPAQLSLWLRDGATLPKPTPVAREEVEK